MNAVSAQTVFEIGTYQCPKEKSQVVLELAVPMTSVEWPVTVERCSACGQEHVLQYEDVSHVPALGYE